MSGYLPLFIAIPLGAAFLIPILDRIWRRFCELISFLSMLAMLVMAFSLVGKLPLKYYMGGWRPPFGINLVLDGFSMLLLIVVSGVSLAAIIFSIPYMELYTSKTKYYTLFMLMVAGMNGVVLTGDMFNIYVFLEIAAIASYSLVAFGCEHEELEASFKYMVLGGVASSFILFGIGILYSVTGTLNMADMARIVGLNGINRAAMLAAVFFIMGFGLKAAMVPFHAWLPDAHPSAPAPISAMLSGVLIKALGIYALARIFYTVLGMNGLFSAIFMTLGGLSMVIGGLLALGQWDLKRLLAYSSISQMGYVMLGLGLGTPLALLGAVFHLMNHATFKSLLFLCSGAIEYSTGTRMLPKMGGLFKRMPVTGTTCSVGALSISGVPPLNGFWSKLIIIIAAVKAGHPVLAAIAVAVSLITLLMFIKVQRYSIFGDLPEGLRGVKEVPVLMCISMIVLAALCVSLGLLYPILKPWLLGPAGEVLLKSQDYINFVLRG